MQNLFYFARASFDLYSRRREAVLLQCPLADSRGGANRTNMLWHPPGSTASTCWLGGGQQEMAKPYSQDLRDRVIDAVRTGKMWAGPHS